MAGKKVEANCKLIADSVANNIVEWFPNPTDGKLTMNYYFDDNTKAELEILNSSG